MKQIILCLSLVIAGVQLLAQAPSGSKLAAEQAFNKELSRVFAYQKEHPTTAAFTSIKAPSLGQSGILTLTFSHITAEGSCREIATIPVNKITNLISDTAIGFRVEGGEIQKIRLCSGKQPSHVSDNILLIGSISDGTIAKEFAAGLDTALRRLQTFYK